MLSINDPEGSGYGVNGAARFTPDEAGLLGVLIGVSGGRVGFTALDSGRLTAGMIGQV